MINKNDQRYMMRLVEDLRYSNAISEMSLDFIDLDFYIKTVDGMEFKPFFNLTPKTFMDELEKVLNYAQHLKVENPAFVAIREQPIPNCGHLLPGQPKKRTKEEILSQIDIALDTKDEQWFQELTDELKGMEGKG